ncbi:MAG: DMT family transporter [Sandaracinaceae bacterium]|nr:DMT family transporter [Sandaracinaceae bacterium]
MRRAHALVALAALSAVWGTQYLVIRLVQAELPPWRAVFLRFVFVALAAQVAVLATGARAPQRTMVLRLAMGATQALSMGLLYVGQKQIASALSSVLMATTPLLVVVMAHRWLGERALARSFAAGAAGIAGIVVIASTQWGDRLAAGGVALVLGAALASAASKTIGKAITDLPIAILLRDMGVVVAALGLAASIVVEREVPWTLGARELMGAAYLGLVASAGANVLYFVLLRRVDVSRLSYLQLVSASVGLIAGVLIAGEHLGASTLTGTALVLAGAAIHTSGAVHKVAVRRQEADSS